MIRVLHLVTDLERGGAERIVLELVRRRDRSAFACGVADLRGGSSLRPEIEAEGARVLRLAPASPRGLRRALAAERIDVLHSHLIRADFLAGAAAGKRSDRSRGRDALPPWITTKHNTHYFRGLRAPYRILDAAYLRRASRIVAVSGAVRSHFVETERLAPGRIEVIPNGITGLGDRDDAEQAALRARVRRHLRIEEDEPLLVHVGSLTRQKGHATLLDALRIVGGRGKRVQLLLAGDGPLRPWIQGRVRRRKLGDRVRLLGVRDDVPLLLRGADLLVLPSRWEGFGLALLEAMDAGLAVVASRVGGIPEVVVDGETGLLVPPGDAEALAAAIVRLLEDPESRCRMGASGRRRVRERFDAGTMARRYEDLYRGMLEQDG
jgi:glycosyltransferase involved in cell wall biosynthesis